MRQFGGILEDLRSIVHMRLGSNRTVIVHHQILSDAFICTRITNMGSP